MRIFLLSLLGFAANALAWSPIPSFVTNDYHHCLLGYAPGGAKTQIDCFESEARDGAPPHVTQSQWKNPLALAAVNFGICVIDDGQLHCMRPFDSRQTDEPGAYRDISYEDLTDVASDGNLDVCVASKNGTVRCQDSGYTENYYYEVPFRLSQKYPSVLAVAHAMGCLIDDDRQVRCWKSEPIDKPDNECLKRLQAEAPRDLQNPAQLRMLFDKETLHVCSACVLDRDAVRCWGDGAATRALPGLRRYSDEPSRPGAPPLFHLEPEALAPLEGDGGVLVNFRGQLWRGEPAGKMQSQGGALLWQSYGPTRCSVTEQELICRNPQEERKEYSVAHPQWLSSTGLYSIESGLRYVAPKVYRRVSALLTETADFLSSFSPDLEARQFFVLEALTPLMESVDTAFFQSDVLPRWHALKTAIEDRRDAHDLQAIPLASGTPVALQLLKSALPALRVLLGDEFGRSDFPVALGNALAEHSERVPKLVASFQPWREKLSLVAKQNSGDGGIARLTLALFDYWQAAKD